jgi:Tol biopolymer transport system component
MGVLAQRSVYIPRVPWRTVIVAALLLVVLAATLAWIGSQRRPAPPFGLARNGLLVYADGGDIRTLDPDSGVSAAILTGPTNDFTAAFSRDGTKLAFLRGDPWDDPSEPDGISIQVANADGTNPIDLTGPLDAPDQWNWSPSGDAIAFQSKVGGTPTLQVVPTDGSAPPRVLDTGMEVTFPDWLPPDGDEIVFRGITETPDGPRSGLYAISPDGGGLRPLSATNGDPDNDFNGPNPSPDGTRLMYQDWDPVAERATLRLLDLAAGTTEAIPRTSARFGEGNGAFSPDGSLVAYLGFWPEGFRLYVTRADGSGEPRALTSLIEGDELHEFSPDGTKVMLNERGTHTLLIDLESGAAETLPEIRDLYDRTWQRLAP